MAYILQKLFGRIVPNMGCLIGYNNTPLRNSETLKLIGYVNSSNTGNLQGYNLEGRGYTY